MSYPGNPALAQETKDRLLRTFTQTLDLAARGGVQEALLGCDFILRLDPLFQPARDLHERLGRATGTIDVEDLRDLVGGGPTTPAPATYGTVQMPAVLTAAPAPAAPTVDPAAVRAAMQRSFEARDFAGVVALAAQQHQLVAVDAALQKIAGEAQAHAEAEPYIRRFLDGARTAFQQGQAEEGERQLQKAATLDSTHPEIAELRQLAGAGEEPPLSLADLPQDFDLADTSSELSFADLDAPGSGFGDLSVETPSTSELVDAGMPSLEFNEPAFGAPQAKASESDLRIQELLDEGEASLDRGEHQAAIDAWSRIFLIDIDHSEAAKRIEQARKLKAEAERQTEELFHEGVARFDAADSVGARERFERVLAQQPGHLAAREYLEQIEAGKVRAAPRPTGAGARSGSATAAAPAAVLKEEILVPPEPGAASPAKAASKPSLAPAGVKRSGRGKTLFLVGGLVLALAAGGGWYLMTHRDRLFPNSQPPAPPGAQQQDAIARATALKEQGKTPIAIAQLRRVPPQDPLYEKAQALITQWQAADQQPPAPATATTAGPSKRDALLESARAAGAKRLFLNAEALYAQAAALAPLEGSAEAELADVRRQVAPLQEAIAFIKQGEYEIALRSLWRLHEADHANPDVLQLMVSSYYNLGVKALQREAPAEAVESFKEALSLSGQDEELQRLARFAGAYVNRSQDLQYKIYVKYLATRG